MIRTKQLPTALLVLCVVISIFSGTAFGAADRYAIVTAVAGTATVTKAGGAKEIRLHVGMELTEGDRLRVGKGGSVTLKVADRNDEIVLGENWNGTLSKLRANGHGGTDTAIKTWSGSMYSNVQTRAGGGSTYAVETPTATMGARGTHFLVTIDPVSGLPVLIVSAGRVDASDTTGESSRPTPVLPAQQVRLYPGESPDIGVDYIDPDDLVVAVDSSVLAMLLKNKQRIDEENDEQLTGDLGTAGGTLTLTDEEVLARYRANVEYALLHLLRSAVAAGTISESQLNDIINAANQQIVNVKRQYDLNRDVPDIDRSAGVDPEEEERRRQQREQAEQKRQQQQQEREDRRQEVQNNNEALLDRIQQRQDEQERANEQAADEQARSAADRHRIQLTEDERRALEERMQQREAERQAQQRSRDEPPTTQPSTPPPVTPPPPRGVTTSTTLELSANAVMYGEDFAIWATVEASGSHDTVPEGGQVEFRIGSTVIGSATILDGLAEWEFDSSTWASLASAGIRDGTHRISARYVGVPQKYRASTSDEVEVEISGMPAGVPVVYVTRVLDTSNHSLEIHVDLANFTGPNTFYFADFRFLELPGLTMSEDRIFYNAAKIVSDEEEPDLEMKYREQIWRDGEWWNVTGYRLDLTGRLTGVDFAERDNVAKIVFVYDPEDDGVDIADLMFDLAYWRFTDKAGQTLDVDIRPGDHIIVTGTEDGPW